MLVKEKASANIACTTLCKCVCRKKLEVLAVAAISGWRPSSSLFSCVFSYIFHRESIILL